MKLLFLVAFALIASHAHAASDLSQFAQAQTAFNAGRAPSAKELYNALWMTTSVANEPSTGQASGLYADGAIPDGQGGALRQIAQIKVVGPKATAKFKYTDANIGTLLGSNTQTGTLTSQGLTLNGPGDAQTCSTKTVCRTLSTGILLCAQSSDDARTVCAKSYKRGAVSAYLGYTPVHP